MTENGEEGNVDQFDQNALDRFNRKAEIFGWWVFALKATMPLLMLINPVFGLVSNAIMLCVIVIVAMHLLAQSPDGPAAIGWDDDEDEEKEEDWGEACDAWRGSAHWYNQV